MKDIFFLWLKYIARSIYVAVVACVITLNKKNDSFVCLFIFVFLVLQSYKFNTAFTWFECQKYFSWFLHLHEEKANTTITTNSSVNQSGNDVRVDKKKQRKKSISINSYSFFFVVFRVWLLLYAIITVCSVFRFI